MRNPISESCCWQDCVSSAAHGLGWGPCTGLVHWYCGRHYRPALERLGELLHSLARRGYL